MFNFQNIGGKIKTLAFVTTITGMVLSLIFGLLSIKNNSTSNGFLIIIIGFIISWISAIFMYGFGELIDKTTEIANNTRKNTQEENITKEETQEKTGN